jgi:hypothetical protein
VRIRGTAIAALTACTFAASGCGSGGGEQLSKADFLAKGDAICKQAHDQFVQLQSDPPNTAGEAAALTDKLIKISRNELAQIDALNGPDELQAPLDRYLRAREDGIALLEKGLQAAEHKDAQGYASAQAKIAAGQVQRLKLAKAVGFTECSQPVGGASAATAP